jgi:RNA polymerase-associated protein
VDCDLVLYESQVIIEYLDERFPHPPLLPVDPVHRVCFRLALSRIGTGWYSLLRRLKNTDGDETQRGRVLKALHDSLTASAVVFKAFLFTV